MAKDKEEYEIKAKHLIYDLYDCKCKTDTMVDMTRLMTTSFEAIRRSGTTMLKAERMSLPYLDGRSTIIFGLNEGHLAVSTYRDHKYVSIDIYCIGGTPSKGAMYLIKMFNPTWFKQFVLTRGNPKMNISASGTIYVKNDKGDYVKNETSKKKSTSK